ncbi:hypothetical protein Cgig2_006252 [Carnegiea gigantea]|uniref:Uncharacterized protein n=1 Tax=Carnegiea gigantea TaxID=171969 RepID=A0A9Q1JHW9_9CARY|nr:hypothetical protein Cgig2_006252 [Carnegiea gigantea]
MAGLSLPVRVEASVDVDSNSASGGPPENTGKKLGFLYHGVPLFSQHRGDGLHLLETFNWRLTRAARPPWPLPEDYRDLCPHFILSDDKEAAHDFHIPKFVRAIFYAMVANEALELGVLSRNLAEDLKLALIDLRCVLSIKKEVVYPWEIYITVSHMTDVQERKLARTKQTARLTKVPELMAKRYSVGNSRSSFESLQQSVKACSTSASSTKREGKVHSSGSHSSASTTKRRQPQEVLSHKVIAEDTRFLGVPERSDPWDGPSSHFRNPRTVRFLKRQALEEKYLLLVGCKFVLLDADAMVNKPPPRCVTIYQAALTYALRFPCHEVILEILNKDELAPVQIMSTSWHYICSFVPTCKLRGLKCSARAFEMVYTAQKAPSEAEEMG